MNDRDRFALIDELFREACQVRGAERAAFLDEKCAGDGDLRREVESLLKLDDVTSGPLDDPPSMATSLIENARMNPAAQTELPRRIGGYRIIQRIGAGGMGTVFEAEQEHPKRMVALKVISPGVLGRSVLRRFQFETEALGRLQHPGIAQIYEAGTFDAGAGEQPFFAMELVEGVPLMQYAKAHELTIAQRLELLASICDAVQHAHQRGVIHRDLKPANVLVTNAGQPKILDFGVARATDSDLQATTVQTNFGQIVGTVPYMSPEQATGDHHSVDTRSDVYSLGVLGYELLTGRLPHDVREKLLHEALRSIREDRPAPLSTHSRLLAGDVATIVGKALEKEPERRYQSAADLAEDIRRYLHNEPITARPPSRMYHLKMFARRNKPIVTAGAIGAGALVIATCVSIGFALSESNQRSRAETRFEDVRALANTFLFDVDDQLQSVPGTTPARETLVTTALIYLDRLAADEHNDPALLDELADAYIRVGDIQGNPRKPNLGDSQSALTSYNKSLEIRRALVEESPSDTAQLAKLAGVHERLGTVKSYLGMSEETLEEYRTALEFTEKSLELEPGNLEARRGIVRYTGTIGDIQRQMGRFDDALESFQREMQEARAVVEIDPDQAQARRALSIACNDVGSIFARRGETDRALNYYEEAMAIRKNLAEKSPDDQRAQRDLSISLNRIGNAQRSLGEYEEALASYQNAFDINFRLVESDPSNARAQNDLAVQYEKVGIALTDLDRHAEALDAFEREVLIWRGLVESDSENMYSQVGLAVGLERCGDALRSLERTAEAIARFEESIDISAGVVAIDPNDSLAQTLQCMTSYRLGGAHEQMAGAVSPDSQLYKHHMAHAARWYQYSVNVRDSAAAINVHLQDEPEDVNEALEQVKSVGG